ncbi:ATP-binding protein [Actinomyces sp.]|uniref:ATP-binding protein n=1 Tax=Actinomyces sp. TaxID=29317 RepID=UPI0026DD39FB|nr:ATP-binding protein [Actinomyces sp.]MDO4900207.1 ATP-binding protein [Actinomyces sp.]
MVRATAEPVFWILLPLLSLPAVCAGTAAAIAIRKASGEATSLTYSQTAMAPDRLWNRALSLSLVIYSSLVVAAAMLPVIPSYDQQDTFIHVPNILVNYYLGVTIAAALVMPLKMRFLYIVLLAPVLIASYPSEDPLLLRIEEVLIFLAPSLGNMGMLTWLEHRAATLDDAEAQHRVQVFRLHTAMSRLRARRRADDFIHDHVLSVLKAVHIEQVDSSLLRSGAREALAGLVSTRRAVSTTSSASLFRELGRNLHRMAGSGVTVTTRIDHDLELPPEAAEAINGAAAEAVRNTLIHAAPHPGAFVKRTAFLRSDSEGITVTVSDDGRGFEPARVAPGRRGLTDSIITRMQAVGGSARIESVPGDGTTVTLTWSISRPATGSTKPSLTQITADTTPLPGTETRPAGTSPLSLASCMETRSTWIVSSCVFALYILITAIEVSAGSYRNSAPVIASLVILGGAAFTLIRTWPHAVLPSHAATLVAAATGLANALVLFQINNTGWPGYASWCQGAGTILCCGLLGRERFGHAWGSMALFLTVFSAWVLNTGRPPTIILTLSAGQLVSLLIWYLAARLSIKVATRTAAAEAVSAALAAERHAHQEDEDMMRRSMAAVYLRLRPILTTLANGEPITDDIRTKSRALEAELRDERRAPFFAGTRVTNSARCARARGIEILLLDDHGDATAANNQLSQRTKDILVERAAEAIDSARRGRVVIRLLPQRQYPRLMSIVTEDEILTLGPDGTPIHDRDDAPAPTPEGTDVGR